MKAIKKYMMMAAVLVSGVLTGCSDDKSEPPIPEPEGDRIGTGAWNNPMTAYQLRLGSVNPERKEVWVTGYIVGVCNTDIGNILNAKCAQFEGPFGTDTNLLIAMTPDETNFANCATVQLPSGPVRDGLNLASNADNLGKLVTIKGVSGRKYCGAYGLRDCTDYNWGTTGMQDEPTEGLAPMPGFWQSFNWSDNVSSYYALGWRNIVTSGGLQGWSLTSFSGNNYMNCSSRYGTAKGGPYEMWLVSPAVDASALTDKTLTFETQARYSGESTLTAFVLKGDWNPQTAEKDSLACTIATPSGGASASWVKSGTVDLSAYTGTIYIAWRYYNRHGGEDNSVTFGIDNINVGNVAEIDPERPKDPNEIYRGLDEDSESCDWVFEDVKLGPGLSYVWSWTQFSGKHYLNGTAYVGGKNIEAESYAISPVIDLAGFKSPKVSFDHAAKFQTTLRQLCGFAVRPEGAAEWTRLEIKQWPVADKWQFSSSGQMDLSAFEGKRIQLAFIYGSNSQGANTWEVRNVLIKGEPIK